MKGDVYYARYRITNNKRVADGQRYVKASAKAAKDRARQLQAQADTSAERLDLQQSRQKLVQLQLKAATSTIKPYT